MDCGRARELFHDYIDGLLSGKEAASLEEHVARCPLCAEELAGLKKVVDRLGEIEEIKAPEGFAARLFERIDEAGERGESSALSSMSGALREDRASVRSTSFFFRILPLAAAAVFLAVLAVVFILAKRDGSEIARGLANRQGPGTSEKIVMEEKKAFSPAAAETRSRKGFLEERKRPETPEDRFGGLFVDKDPRTGAPFDCLVVSVGKTWKGLPGSDAATLAPAESFSREGASLKKSRKDLAGGGLIEVYEADAARFQDVVASFVGSGVEAIYGCVLPEESGGGENEVGKKSEMYEAESVPAKMKEFLHGGVAKGNPRPVVIWTGKGEKIGRESSLSALGRAESIGKIVRDNLGKPGPREKVMSPEKETSSKVASRRASGGERLEKFRVAARGRNSVSEEKEREGAGREAPGDSGAGKKGGRRFIVIVFRESALGGRP